MSKLGRSDEQVDKTEDSYCEESYVRLGKAAPYRGGSGSSSGIYLPYASKWNASLGEDFVYPRKRAPSNYGRKCSLRESAGNLSPCGLIIAGSCAS